jgi:hypothetical protein
MINKQTFYQPGIGLQTFVFRGQNKTFADNGVFDSEGGGGGASQSHVRKNAIIDYVLSLFLNCPPSDPPNRWRQVLVVSAQMN